MVYITKPTSPPLVSIPAGTNYEVIIFYDDYEIDDAIVSLICSGLTVQILSLSYELSGQFPVPATAYGNCAFSVSSAFYDSGPNVNVIITQQISFTSPLNNAVIDINNPIPIKLATTGNTVISEGISLQLRCSNGYLINLPSTVTTNSGSFYYYSYSSEAFGPCSLGVLTPLPASYLVPPPSSLNFFLKYTLTITSPDLIYIGQTFSVILGCAQTPGVTTTTLYLYQSGLLKETYLNVAINSVAPIPLIAPTNLVSGTDCELKTAADSSYFKQATKTGISVSNVQLQFAEPALSTFAYTETIPILVNSASVTNIQPVTVSVTLTCSSVTIDTFNVVTGEQTDYSNTKFAVGPCSLSVTVPLTASYLIAPSARVLTIIGAIDILTPAASPLVYVAAGNPLSITLNYIPDQIPSASSTATLSCPGFDPITATINSGSGSLSVLSDYYGNPCTLTVSSTYYTQDTVDVAVTQQLSFASPSASSVININSPITIRLATTGNTTINEIIDLQLNCDNGYSYDLNDTVATNSAYDYAYSASAYGPCTLGVISTPSYLVPPSDVSFTLKYVLTITPPSTIYIGQTFTVTLGCAQTPGVSTTTLYMYQSGLLMSTYENVDINRIETLVAPTNLTASSPCTLQTALVDDFFNQVTSIPITVYTVQLQFASPEASSSYITSEPIPVLINSSNVTSISSASVTLQFHCSSILVDTFTVSTGATSNYNNPNNGIGPCTLTISSAPSYFDFAGISTSFNIKYEPVYDIVPTLIIVNNPFNIKINTTITPVFALTTDLALYCNGVIFQSWNNFPLNTLVSLTIVPNTIYTNNCYFYTADNVYVESVAYSVAVSLAKSPTNGNLYPITNAELLEFLSSIIFTRFPEAIRPP